MHTCVFSGCSLGKDGRGVGEGDGEGEEEGYLLLFVLF